MYYSLYLFLMAIVRLSFYFFYLTLGAPACPAIRLYLFFAALYYSPFSKRGGRNKKKDTPTIRRARSYHIKH